jgi:hypothetical protein
MSWKQSDMIPGSQGNYRWRVRFDLSPQGYLGIDQYDGNELKDRVLLSPAQIEALRAFTTPPRKAKP